MRTQHGFTLVEMGIVIIIIALIASSVFVGRHMIQAGETRALMSELDSYTTAFKEFTDKYQAIPGDMNNATAYWETDASCPNTPTNTEVKSATCNGDGNGIIGDWTNTASATALSEYEWFRAWQHLADSELIGGKFTGVSGATSTTATLGVNVPLASTGKGGWTLLYMVSDGTTDTAFFNSAVASHVLMYGNQTTNSFTDGPILTPISTKNIDDKIDDGMPFTGNIRVKKNTATTCTVSSATTSDYLVTSTLQACQFLFLMGV